MKEFLLAIICFSRGWFIALNRPGVLVLKWVVNVLFAVGSGLGIALLFYRRYEHSEMNEGLLEQISLDTIADFSINSRRPLPYAPYSARF